jgi:ubiquinone biosynthesis protein COQ9
MIAPPERSEARDAAIEAVLPHVAALGWSLTALRRAVGEDGVRLFPGGGPDLVEAYIDLIDRRMVVRAAEALAEARLSQRVRILIDTRLRLSEDQKPAVRRAALLLAMPQHATLAARCTARTVDAIWHAAGDKSADFAWYTKRAILAGVYSSTLFYWMNETTTQTASLDFLDRRLAGVSRINKFRGAMVRVLSRKSRDAQSPASSAA